MVLCLATASAAFADTVSDQVVSNLMAQGYRIVTLDRTWLGRMRVLVRNKEVQREIVFNPSTGEILRDYSVLLASLPPDEQGGTDTPETVGVAGLPVQPDDGVQIGIGGGDGTQSPVVIGPIEPRP